MKHYKRIILLSALMLVAIILSGCGSRATISTYSDPSFAPGSIKRVAIFPIKNTSIAPGEARVLEREMARAISSINPSVHIVGSTEAIQLLNEHDLADAWAEFLDNYTSSGIPNVRKLFEIGDSLGVDAILQGEIIYVFQRDGIFSAASGQTRVTVRYSILGTDSGKLLWEATTDASKTTATSMEKAPPLVDVIRIAQEKINANLPF